MTVREIIVDTLVGQQKHIVIDRDDGSVISFPADPENPNYATLMQLVDAGELTIASAEGA